MKVLRVLTGAPRRLRALVVVGLLAVGVGLTAAPAASATSGYGYDGLWPDLAGCASSSWTAKQATIYQGNATVGYVQLRYSNSCRTAWARVISYYNNGVGEVAGVQRYSDNLTYSCNSYNYSSSLGGYSCYTRMVYDGGELSRASGVAPNWYGGTSKTTLTGWY